MTVALVILHSLLVTIAVLLLIGCGIAVKVGFNYAKFLREQRREDEIEAANHWVAS